MWNNFRSIWTDLRFDRVLQHSIRIFFGSIWVSCCLARDSYRSIGISYHSIDTDCRSIGISYRSINTDCCSIGISFHLIASDYNSMTFEHHPINFAHRSIDILLILTLIRYYKTNKYQEKGIIDYTNHRFQPFAVRHIYYPYKATLQSKSSKRACLPLRTRNTLISPCFVR